MASSDTSTVTPPREPLPRVELKTRRLTLRPWEERDIDQVHRICQDPAIQRWTTVPSPYRRVDAEHFVLRTAPDGFAHGTDAILGAFLDGTGEAAGAVGLHGFTTGADHGPARTRQAEVGYWANPATRGRGYLTEAVREIVRWGFDDLGLERIAWQAFDGNVASWRVAQKVGFTMIGLQRSQAVIRGEATDLWLADMLPSDPRL